MTDQHRGPVLDVLAVADPRPQTAIGDWKPFAGGSRLSEIIGRCNDECSATYRSRRWAPDDVDALTELFNLLPFDLSYVNQLRAAQLATVRFILLDPASLARLGPAADDVLGRLTQLIDKLPPTHLLYVTQVAGPQPAESRAGAFARVRAVADRPEFVSSDRELSGFLLRSCQLLQALQAELASSVTRGDAPVFRSRDPGRPPHLAHQLLDVALDTQLDVEQAGRFAQAVGRLGGRTDILSGVSVPDLLREAARAIKAGESMERVAVQMERRAFFEGEGRLGDAIFQRDVTERLRDGGGGRNPRLRGGGPFGGPGGGSGGRGGGGSSRGGGRSL
ncbi:MAG TPA: hypothetical protein VFR37_00920 [Longimicrobium sp.]|nr:hypothetical protein [Longimicrobium sp.]